MLDFKATAVYDKRQSRERQMTFWSSQRLEANLRKISNKPNKDMVDCNALTLSVGDEVYVTPGLDLESPSTYTKQQLKENEAFPIPPGRFAFLLTEEVISIPKEVMGLISIKATFKLRGLVNVSGFHVDPGWSGKLVFTVFNAGPATIHLQRGLPVFLLWIADLDAPTKKFRTKPSEPGIPTSIINNITGVADTIYAVEKRLKQEIKDVEGKQDTFRNEVAEIKERQGKILLYFGIASIIATAVMTLALKLVVDHYFPSSPAAPAAPPAAEMTAPTGEPVQNNTVEPPLGNELPVSNSAG
jgi:dCTP deaminase